MSAQSNLEDKRYIVSQVFLALSFSRHVHVEGTLFLTMPPGIQGNASINQAAKVFYKIPWGAV